MSQALYVVIFSRGKWWIDYEGKAHGPFDHQDAATEEGRELAKYSAHMGRRTELLVPDEHGRYRVAWSSDNEPHAGADYAVALAAE